MGLFVEVCGEKVLKLNVNKDGSKWGGRIVMGGSSEWDPIGACVTI